MWIRPAKVQASNNFYFWIDQHPPRKSLDNIYGVFVVNVQHNDVGKIGFKQFYCKLVPRKIGSGVIQK